MLRGCVRDLAEPYVPAEHHFPITTPVEHRCRDEHNCWLPDVPWFMPADSVACATPRYRTRSRRPAKSSATVSRSMVSVMSSAARGKRRPI
jgi:hypothetical protein